MSVRRTLIWLSKEQHVEATTRATGKSATPAVDEVDGDDGVWTSRGQLRFMGDHCACVRATERSARSCLPLGIMQARVLSSTPRHDATAASWAGKRDVWYRAV